MWKVKKTKQQQQEKHSQMRSAHTSLGAEFSKVGIWAPHGVFSVSYKNDSAVSAWELWRPRHNPDVPAPLDSWLISLEKCKMMTQGFVHPSHSLVILLSPLGFLRTIDLNLFLPLPASPSHGATGIVRMKKIMFRPKKRKEKKRVDWSIQSVHIYFSYNSGISSSKEVLCWTPKMVPVKWDLIWLKRRWVAQNPGTLRCHWDLPD